MLRPRALFANTCIIHSLEWTYDVRHTTPLSDKSIYIHIYTQCSHKRGGEQLGTCSDRAPRLFCEKLRVYAHARAIHVRTYVRTHVRVGYTMYIHMYIVHARYTCTCIRIYMYYRADKNKHIAARNVVKNVTLRD